MAKTSPLQRIELVLLGILAGLALIEVTLQVAGLLVSFPQKWQNRITGSAVQSEDDVRILVLGESTTAGGPQSWPSQMEGILNNRSPRRFRVFNAAIGGSNTAFLLRELESNLLRFRPHIVITMMGVNDDHLSFVYTSPQEPVGKRILSGIGLVKLGRWMVSHKVRQAYTPPVEQEDLGHSWTKDPECQRKAALVSEQFSLGRYSAIEQPLKEIIQECRPEDDWPYALLVTVYLADGKEQEARRILRAAAEESPFSYGPLVGLAKLWDENTTVYWERVLQMNPTHETAYESLLTVYSEKGEWDKFDRLVAQFMSRDDFSTLHHSVLVSMACPSAPIRSSPRFIEYYERQNFTLVDADGLDVTRFHYQELHRILQEKGIPYFAMQYPLLDTDMLESFFGDEEGVVFVSNRENFQAALRRWPYGEIFHDHFGLGSANFHGDFGHTTPLGSSLIAESAATAVLRELNLTESVPGPEQNI